MTNEEFLAKYEPAVKAYFDAAETYREAKATKYLALANPADGGKKPSDAVITATLDCDPELVALRKARNAADATLTVMKAELSLWAFKA